MCGAARKWPSSSVKSPGLSPRVRGSPNPFRAFRHSGRSIPACAGQPSCPPPPLKPSRVYPRVCGAASSRVIQTGVPKGLSPRVRGSHKPYRLLSEHRRSIPACAGQPLAYAKRLCATEVYPRVCGAAVRGFLGAAAGWGLSPRVRGSHKPLKEVCPSLRSIPACAGQPSSAHTFAHDIEVYPRVCGAAVLSEQYSIAAPGLSPRVRGSRGR